MERPDAYSNWQARLAIRFRVLSLLVPLRRWAARVSRLICRTGLVHHLRRPVLRPALRVRHMRQRRLRRRVP